MATLAVRFFNQKGDPDEPASRKNDDPFHLSGNTFQDSSHYGVTRPKRIASSLSLFSL